MITEENKKRIRLKADEQSAFNAQGLDYEIGFMDGAVYERAIADTELQNKEIDELTIFHKSVCDELHHYKALAEAAEKVIVVVKKEPEVYLAGTVTINHDWSEWFKDQWTPALKYYEQLKNKKV